ncbi:TonB-dependent receptor [Dyella mobilis]|uniref:TonB-dependent receptor n=1 Tax=Dyella mobilis TaxID=1849582 RepID=A0ABS2KBH2_9GAMM|nr:TonB-dependent receptor [Dyella mobilis]MBM7128514.1 TonB-dependent receptor [Dyella mobilis]GLQ99583.1 Oar protein [Dyella mobilis]
MQIRQHNNTPNYRRIALSIALVLGVDSGAVLAQSTSGSIYGSARAGAEVTITNEGNGSSRNVTVGPNGAFQFNALLPGKYVVKLADGGSTSTQEVTVLAGQGANVNLAVTASAVSAKAKNLDTISVTANSLANIDVSSAQTNTVITAEQMKTLPIPRNVTAIALLTPGAVKGDSSFGNLASFGGASVAENAYYVNGFNVTNQFDSLSFSQVPFEAIDQESVQDGGYGAEYGNATGGVISVQTKRGTNEWKGGVDVTWNPVSLMAKQPNIYLKNGNPWYNASRNNNYAIGNSGSTYPIDFSSRWNAWLGGPLIKDKLFIFGLVSGTKTNSSGYGYVDQAGGGGYTALTEKDPYWLLKLDWNINDSNILEYTGFNDTRHVSTDVYYDGFGDNGHSPYHYDYQGVVKQKLGGQTNILKYTSYITDDLTLTMQYGKNQNHRINTAIAADGTVESYDGNILNAANAPGCPAITDLRNPVVAGQIAPYAHCNFIPGGVLTTDNGQDKRSSFRIDLEYKLGDHDITGGWSRDRTSSSTGQAYEGGAQWVYGPLNPETSGAAPEDNQVTNYVFATGAKVSTTQRAAYLQDNWHITDNFLLRLGLRNDQFNNQNGLGQTYAKQDHNLQPRLGFSWDVHGDSTLKIYGSAGDYSLPIDAGVAIRGASASLYSTQSFTYTGVDPVTGVPQGLTPLTPVQYLNFETGSTPNPTSYTTANLKPFKQREFILGAQQQVGDWTVGAKAAYRKVLNGIDDICDFRPIAAYANAMYGFGYRTDSLAPMMADGSNANPGLIGCFIANPGNGVQLMLPLDPNSNQLYPVNLSGEQIGEPRYKRNYYALSLTAERNFNNTYYLNFSYTYARSYGNTEGLVDSNIGQADTGTSELFDYPEIMYGANGNQPNNHKHTFKAYGAYKLSNEWTIGANLLVQTGRPRNCYGDNPADLGVVGGYAGGKNPEPGQPSVSSGTSPYIYCVVNGVGAVLPRGSAGNTPTLWQLDLNAAYKPEWFKGLTMRATVFNVFNRHTPVSVYENQNAFYTPSANGGTWQTLNDTKYLVPTGYQAPRYVQLNAEYDF